jgi:hypothetical protein
VQAAAVLTEKRVDVFHFFAPLFGFGLQGVEFDQLIFLEALDFGEFGSSVGELLFEVSELTGERKAFGFDFLAGRRQFSQGFFEVGCGA